MYYLEYCHERNEELAEDCGYKYYVLHCCGVSPYCDDHVYYDSDEYVVLKLFKL